ncbi:hypothetical protein BJX68DRAFT_242476 [Aspergillus pseudodeflectus]|uniref:Uncharacterized protein n=1 Tax=Aspergillus pseudodeflectus TaxID=176178 RepID=A0ABR4JYR0_9EURO
MCLMALALRSRNWRRLSEILRGVLYTTWQILGQEVGLAQPRRRADKLRFNEREPWNAVGVVGVMPESGWVLNKAIEKIVYALLDWWLSGDLVARTRLEYDFNTQSQLSSRAETQVELLGVWLKDPLFSESGTWVLRRLSCN